MVFSVSSASDTDITCGAASLSTMVTRTALGGLLVWTLDGMRHPPATVIRNCSRSASSSCAVGMAYVPVFWPGGTSTWKTLGAW